MYDDMHWLALKPGAGEHTTTARIASTGDKSGWRCADTKILEPAVIHTTGILKISTRL